MKILIFLLTLIFVYGASAQTPVQQPARCTELMDVINDPSSEFMVRNTNYDVSFLDRSHKNLLSWQSVEVKEVAFGPENLDRVTVANDSGQVTYYIYDADKVVYYEGQKVGNTFSQVACVGLEDREYLYYLFSGINLDNYPIGQRVGVWGANYKLEDLPQEVGETLNSWLESKNLKTLGKDYLYTIEDIVHVPLHVGVIGFQIQIATEWSCKINDSDWPAEEYLDADAGSVLVIDKGGQIQLQENSPRFSIEFAEGTDLSPLDFCK
ncbi:MAG: hypothetical protein HRT44_05805 [Bdellovibrionales bacterium]|nr:hypothetical protein [Bdellovibrionales bacterium]NQZ18759.1 hypothetical protein [Bdellovibrionales bacterium]